jgi:hypothetical protein
MFGLKKNKPKELESSPKVEVETIPDLFYGGKNPVIYENGSELNSKRPADLQPQIKNVEKPLNQVQAQPEKQGIFAKLFSNKLVLYIGGGLFFVSIIAGISYYYINQAKQGTAQAPVVQMLEEKVISEDQEVVEQESANVTSTEEINEHTEQEKIEEPKSLSAVPIEFPSMFLAYSADMDSDSLSDAEEDVFNTDSGVWDTDKDGYYDGQEVSNLYNPIGIAPVKIIDSGLVKEYINPTWLYRVYYPSLWEIGSVDEKNSQVLISSVAGDYIEIRVFEKEDGTIFEDWFAKNASGQKITDLQPFSNRFLQEAKKRSDGLVAYFEDEGLIYVLTYHVNSENLLVAFRRVFEIVFQSFRTNKNAASLPSQPAIPKEPYIENVKTNNFQSFEQSLE